MKALQTQYNLSRTGFKISLSNVFPITSEVLLIQIILIVTFLKQNLLHFLNFNCPAPSSNTKEQLLYILLTINTMIIT